MDSHMNENGVRENRQYAEAELSMTPSSLAVHVGVGAQDVAVDNIELAPRVVDLQGRRLVPVVPAARPVLIVG